MLYDYVKMAEKMKEVVKSLVYDNAEKYYDIEDKCLRGEDHLLDEAENLVFEDFLESIPEEAVPYVEEFKDIIIENMQNYFDFYYLKPELESFLSETFVSSAFAYGI